MKAIKIESGQKFAMLTVISVASVQRGKQKYRIATCKCDCGVVTRVTVSRLVNSVTVSCGCYQKIAATGTPITHGLTKTRLYQIWLAMKKRCYGKDKWCKNYKGRGIIVCDEWQNDFVAFRHWAMENGYGDNLTIDRIDCNGNYTPSNCRWVSMKVQQRNRRNNVYIDYAGRLRLLVEVCDEFDIPHYKLRDAIRRGKNPSIVAYRYLNR